MLGTLLIADAEGDSVVIVANGTVVENVRFAEEMGGGHSDECQADHGLYELSRLCESRMQLL